MNATTSKPHATLKALALISIALLLISGFLAIFYTQPESIGKPAFYTMLLLVIAQGPLAGVFSYALKALDRKSNLCLFVLVGGAAHRAGVTGDLPSPSVRGIGSE